MASALPGLLLYPINMRVGSKFQVVCAFIFRLPLIALSSLHLSYLEHYSSSQQPMLAITEALVVQQCMLTWSLVSATIPTMSGFMKSFSMGMGLGVPRDTRVDISRSGSSYPLQTFSTASPADQGTTTGPGDARQETLVSVSDRDASVADYETGVRRSGSQEMIIYKDSQG